MVEIANAQNAFYIRQNHFDNDRMAGSVPVWKNTTSSDVISSRTALSLSGQSQAEVSPPSLSFGELVDTFNPLHHLPVVGNVYRSLTNDDISAVSRVVGGTIYGGAVGGAISLINAAVEEHSGQSLGTTISSKAQSDKGAYPIIDEPRMAGGISKNIEK